MLKNVSIEFMSETKVKNIKDKLRDLLSVVDYEFVPSLSSRDSTTQTSLSSSEKTLELDSYFQGMMEQINIVMLSNDNLLGFVSFRHNHRIDSLEKYSPCTYLSTIAVNPVFRGEKVATKLYGFMMNEVATKYPSKYLLTRTWSTNEIHIKLLKNLGFKLIKTVENQRGKGVDTVYYAFEQR